MLLHVYIKFSSVTGPRSWDGLKLTFGINAPPTKGAANLELINKVSSWLSLPKHSIYLVSGFTSRHKTLQIDAEHDEIVQKIKNVPKIQIQERLL